MIIKYEIEQFIKEIEEKLPSMKGKQLETWQDKIAILNRVNIEFMEYEKLLRKLAIDVSNSGNSILKLEREIEILKKEIEHLKENIK